MAFDIASGKCFVSKVCGLVPSHPPLRKYVWGHPGHPQTPPRALSPWKPGEYEG